MSMQQVLTFKCQKLAHLKVLVLQENGVDKIFKLDRLDKQKALGGCNQ